MAPAFSWLDRWLGRNAVDGYAPPEPDRPALFAVIREHLDSGTGALTVEDLPLPDEAHFFEGRLHWAPGALDGSRGHHGGIQSEDDSAQTLYRLIKKAIYQPSPENRAALYEALREETALDQVDALIDCILAAGDLPREGLRRLALWLSCMAPDREPLKLGIALLGLCQEPEDLEILMTLGAHDEFTLFAATALQNSGTEVTARLWTLARRVQGWGRIQTVERLVQDPDLPDEIRDWLLREGYRNRITPEYLALACAVHGRLKAVLSADTVDADLLAAAGEIIQALISGGPAPGLEVYEDGPVAVERYLAHLGECTPQRLDELLVVADIHDFLKQTDIDWETRPGWHAILRHRLRHACEARIALSDWVPMLEAAMASGDGVDGYIITRSAGLLGVSPWDWLWKRLQAHPHDAHAWYFVMEACDEGRLAAVLDFAKEALPLEELATGPADELGIGTGYALHQCLDSILQDLKRFPGEGWLLIKAGLFSPVTRNRNMALQALAEWKRRPQEVNAALEQLLFREPNEDTRQRIKRLLKPGPAEPPPAEPPEDPAVC